LGVLGTRCDGSPLARLEPAGPSEIDRRPVAPPLTDILLCEIRENGEAGGVGSTIGKRRYFERWFLPYSWEWQLERLVLALVVLVLLERLVLDGEPSRYVLPDADIGKNERDVLSHRSSRPECI
jgi:hypothetical protein